MKSVLLSEATDRRRELAALLRNLRSLRRNHSAADQLRAAIAGAGELGTVVKLERPAPGRGALNPSIWLDKATAAYPSRSMRS